jgi:hypothetical protein
MENINQPLEDIKTIKKIMEQSSRFLSLSGLSGVSAGIFAIAGAVVAKLIIQGPVINAWGYSNAVHNAGDSRKTILFLLLNATTVLILALSSALFFSYRKARKSGQKIWTPITKRLLLSLAIPLITGGLFVLLTLGHIPGSVLAASTLIFYGLALVNAAKFTFGEIFWLGLFEIATGLICLALPGYVFVFWTFGFGILHIVYGTVMYFKYKG